MRKRTFAARAAPQTELADDIAPATPAGVVVSGPSECGMTEGRWSGLPHWSCKRCSFETLVKTEADRHTSACPANHGV